MPDLSLNGVWPCVNFTRLRRGFILHIEGRTWLLRIERVKR